jgi:hypothetical protein
MGPQSRLGAVAAIARRRYWRTTDAAIVIGAWRRSGESQTRFAQRYGLDPKRIGRWAGRLARDGGERGARGVSAGLQFHPVRVVPPIGLAGAWAIEIALGDGRTVRVPSGFAADDLARAVAVLTDVVVER